MKRNNFEFREVDKKFTSCPGQQVEEVYDWVKDENGVLQYIKVGERNIFEYIQASKDLCDIQSIVERVANGESNLLNITRGEYVDISNIPTNYNDLVAQSDILSQKFDTLSDEVKAVFGNDYKQFVDSVLNNTLDTLLNKQEKKEEEIKENE